jgi:hypothetical protein
LIRFSSSPLAGSPPAAPVLLLVVLGVDVVVSLFFAFLFFVGDLLGPGFEVFMVDMVDSWTGRVRRWGPFTIHQKRGKIQTGSGIIRDFESVAEANPVLSFWLLSVVAVLFCSIFIVKMAALARSVIFCAVATRRS